MRTREQIIAHLSACHRTWARPRHKKGPQRWRPVNEFRIGDSGLRVAELLDNWHGLHHFEDRELGRVDWGREFVELVLYHPSLATFDGSMLTRLIILAHDHAIRVAVTASGNRLRYVMTPRARAGSISACHPTMEDALAVHRGAPVE